jgi:multicomponent Na+:H+ antiporter subunit F
MTTLYSILSIVLVLSLLSGLVRIFLGPTKADRMLAAQLFGTVGVALLLLLSVFNQNWLLLDVALILAVLASVTLIAFIKLGELKK